MTVRSWWRQRQHRRTMARQLELAGQAVELDREAQSLRLRRAQLIEHGADPDELEQVL